MPALVRKLQPALGSSTFGRKLQKFWLQVLLYRFLFYGLRQGLGICMVLFQLFCVNLSLRIALPMSCPRKNEVNWGGGIGLNNGESTMEMNCPRLYHMFNDSKDSTKNYRVRLKWKSRERRCCEETIQERIPAAIDVMFFRAHVW